MPVLVAQKGIKKLLIVSRMRARAEYLLLWPSTNITLWGKEHCTSTNKQEKRFVLIYAIYF